MSAAEVFTSARRYYLTKAYQSGQRGDYGSRAAWLAKQAAEDGTALDAAVPYQTELAALVPPFTTLEDLTGSSVDELQRVGLPRAKADAVIAALA